MLRVAVLILALVLAHPVNAERYALLIGNQTYVQEVGPLQNPINDINLVARSLEQIGFKAQNIRRVENANRVKILSEVDSYVDRLSKAGTNAVGFFYYSGHGVANQRDKRNYLIPVGVRALDATLWYSAIPLDDIVRRLSDTASNAAHFVVFDACRNLLRTQTRGSKGFLPVSAKRGMFIAFSTDPGHTASDEGQASGPYAAALAAELVKPGQHHLDLFQNVKERVLQSANGQTPWERNGLVRRVYLAGKEAAARSAISPKPTPPTSEPAIAWRVVEASKDCRIVRAFADQYARSVWAKFAETRLTALDCPLVPVDLDPQRAFVIAGQSFRKNDWASARPYLEHGARKGHAPSMAMLGEVLTMGLGGAKDVIGGFNWLQKAADKQDSHGTFALGFAYNDGTGTAVNPKKAASLFLNALRTSKNEAEQRHYIQILIGSKTRLRVLTVHSLQRELGIKVTGDFDAAMRDALQSYSARHANQH